LGVAVVPTNGRTGQGRDALVEAILAGGRRAPRLATEMPPAVDEAAAALAPDFAARFGGEGGARVLLPSYLGSQAAADELAAELAKDPASAGAAAKLQEARTRLAATGLDVAVAAAQARYAAIEKLTSAVVTDLGASD